MLRITVELLPLGRVDKARTLGVAYITNNGTGTPTRGNYNVKVPRRRRGLVEGFPRRRLGAWNLLSRALASVGAC